MTKPDLWEQAVATLSAEDRTQYVDSSKDTREVLQKVQVATEDAKRTCIAKGWRVYRKKNGEEVKLRHVLERLSTWVEGATKAVDLGVSFDQSGHAALPWSVIKSVITVGSSNIEVFSNLVEGVESMAGLIARYAVLEKLYLNGTGEAVAGLRESIVKLYVEILIYLARARSYFSGNTFKKMGKGVIEPVRKHYDVAKISEVEVHHWMELVKADFDHDMAKAAIQNQVALEKILHGFNAPITRMTSQLDDLHDNLDREERKNLFRWMSTIEYRSHHDDLSRGLLVDSGQWLLDNQQFIEWGQSSDSAILWLHGIPGSGKTRLVSRIVDVMADDNSCSRSIPIAFCYCARSTAEPERGKPNEILGAILRQLSSTKPDEPIRGPVATEYEKRKKKAAEDCSRIKKLSVEDCTRLIIELTKNGPAFIIIDALDECDEDTRHELLEALEVIIQKTVEIVKILVSSRDDIDIVSSSTLPETLALQLHMLNHSAKKLKLESCTNVSISADNNGDDIARFVVSEVDRLISKKLLLDGKVTENFRKKITRSLISGAQGMFRWVALSLETLQQIKYRRDFEAALGRLPSKLSDLYDIIHGQIDAGETYGRVIALKTFKWLLCAQRLLTIQELAAAVSLAIDDNTESSSNDSSTGSSSDSAVSSTQYLPSFDAGNPNSGRLRSDEDDVLRLCRGLVILDCEQGVFRFAHQSVREYLLSRIEYTAASQHSQAVERCIDIYLADAGLYSLDSDSLWWNDYLRRYAVFYLPMHLYFLTEPISVELRNKCRVFLVLNSETSPAYRRWIQDYTARNEERKEFLRSITQISDFDTSLSHYYVEKSDRFSSRYDYLRTRPHTHLTLLSAFGYPFLLTDFGESLTDCNMLLSGSNDAYTLLTIASSEGHLPVVKILLEKGANVNVHFRSTGNALHQAAEHGHISIAKLLLQNGANFNDLSEYWGTALNAASGSGHLPVVQMLLSEGADVNAQSGYCEKALWVASRYGNGEVVKFLLENGAKVEDWYKALAAASRYGHTSVVQILLAAGADVNAHVESSSKVLNRAAASGRLSTAKFLIDSGAEMNARSGNDGTTALIEAAKNGLLLLVQMLLGHLLLVRMLLGEGAKVNAHSGYLQESSLWVASSQGHEEIVRLLIERGAEINALNGSDRSTPLIQASEQGHENIVKMLIKNGADIKFKDEASKTALSSALQNRNDSIVEFLIGKGAEVNLGDEKLRWSLTRFISETGESCLPTVRKLLKGPSNVHATEVATDLLGKAAEKSQLSLARLLLEYGANANADGGQALRVAASRGQTAIVELLLDHDADINIRDKDGHTSLYHAYLGNHQSSIQLLTEHGAVLDVHERFGLSIATQGRIRVKSNSERRHENYESLKDRSGEQRS